MGLKLIPNHSETCDRITPYLIIRTVSIDTTDGEEVKGSEKDLDTKVGIQREGIQKDTEGRGDTRTTKEKVRGDGTQVTSA